MKLAIIGSRSFTCQEKFDKWIARAVELWGMPEEVVSGGARGADTLGTRWARSKGVPVLIYQPDWAKYGKAAGPIRNRDIIARATHVLAFPSTQGKGTQQAIGLAEKDPGKKLMIHWLD